MDNPQNIQIVKTTYENIAEYFAPLLQVENSSVEEVEFMDSFLSQVPANGNVADLGCGVGKHGRYCANKGCSVTGFDVSEKMIELAKKYNGEYDKLKFLHVANMCDIKSDILFDGVVAMYSLIHLTEEQACATLINIKDYMKDGAKIVLSVYRGQRNGYYEEALNPELKQFYKDYQKDSLVSLIEKSGLIVDTITVWNDNDIISACNPNVEFGVIGLIAHK